MPFLIGHVFQLWSSLLAPSGLNPVCLSLLFIGDPRTGHAIPGTVSQVTNTEEGVNSLDLLPADLADTMPRILLVLPASHNCGSTLLAQLLLLQDCQDLFRKAVFPVSWPSVYIVVLVYSIPAARLSICFCWTLCNSCQPISPGCQSPSEQQRLLPPVTCHLHTCGEGSLCHQPGHQSTLLSQSGFLRDTSS